MKKQLLILILLTLGLNAIEPMSYKATIDVKALKTNGKSWDISGGAPEIYMKVEGRKFALKKECIDSYKCKNITFVSTLKKFYIEVYDMDLISDDIIGKGECRIGSLCHVGQATVKIEKVNASPIVLADARLSALELKQGIEIKIKLMSEDIINGRVVPTEKGLNVLMEAISTLRVYGTDIGKEAKNNLINIVKQLRISGFQNKTLLKKLDDIARSSYVVST